MGNEQTGGEATGTRVTGADFEVLQLIGKGAFGKVWLVEKKDTKKVYAMKVLNKKNIVQEKLIEHISVERDVMLSMGHHPFIIKLNFAFQTDDQLFFILDYVGGGSLLQHLQLEEEGCFTPATVKFYAAEILLGIQSLHANNIIYRDLKLENILISKEGHAILTDFGLSAKLKGDKSKVNSFSGTAIYLAPELLLDKTGEGHGKSVDWWAFGVLLNILFTGSPPFWSENFNELFEMIMNDPVVFDDPNLTPEAIDLISKLLDRDVTKRLGCLEGGAEDIKKHPFFADVDWEEVLNLATPPPIVPKFDAAEEAKKIFDPNEKISIGRKKRDDKRFRGFSYMGSNNISPLDKISEQEKEIWKLDDQMHSSEQQTLDRSHSPTNNNSSNTPTITPNPPPSPAKSQTPSAFKKVDLLKKPRQSIAISIKSKLTKKRSGVSNPMSPKAEPEENNNNNNNNNAFAKSNNNAGVLSPRGKSTVPLRSTSKTAGKSSEPRAERKTKVRINPKPVESKSKSKEDVNVVDLEPTATSKASGKSEPRSERKTKVRINPKPVEKSKSKEDVDSDSKPKASKVEVKLESKTDMSLSSSAKF